MAAHRFFHRWRAGVFGLLLAWLAPVAWAQPNAATGPEPLEAYESPTNGLGDWIWAAKTFDQQTCLLWRAFTIPTGVTVARARLLMTVDNEFTVALDGRDLGRGAEWRELFDFDLAPLLSPGRHVLAVTGYNSAWAAGLILGLDITLADGRTLAIKSDADWRVVPVETRNWKTALAPEPGWPAATIVGQVGVEPRWATPQNINVMPTLQPVRVYFWQTGWFQISLGALCGIVLLISGWLLTQLARHRKEEKLLQRERARIARDIHDDIGARMTQLVLHGEVAQNSLPETSATRRQIGHLCEEARGLLATMDEVLWAVNPRRDTLRDFASYVCHFTQEYLKPTRIQCWFEVDPALASEACNLPLRRSLLMAIKETLHNAVKHSDATELRLQIHWRGQQLIVAVSDNGKGFDPARAKTGRNGLLNMAQRLAELGGTCRVISRPGQGCRIELAMPLKHPRQGWWRRFGFAAGQASPVDETKKS